MYVIARKAETSTGVEYIKKYTKDETTWSLSEAQIYHDEEYADMKCAELDGGFKVIKIQ